MRWTIRGIPTDTADAVRDAAFETGSSLGEVLVLCVQHGLPEARRQLEAEYAKQDELGILLNDVKQAFEEVQKAVSSFWSSIRGPA